jgi:hypothetical protein
MSWFIPPEFDDGFSTFEGTVATRPMLHMQKLCLKRWAGEGGLTSQELREATLRPPWLVFARRPADHYLTEVLEEISKKILSYTSAQEAADYRELLTGISFFHDNPGMACMPCKVCHEIIVDIDKGVPYIPIGGSDPVPRPPHLNVPCDAGRKCPKGHWSKPKGFSKLCESVWRHYWMMKAAGKQAPDCPIIHRNWALIDWIISGKRANLNPMAVGST